MAALDESFIPRLAHHFTELAAIATNTYRTELSRSDAFAEVGTGADGLPTTRIDFQLEQICIEYLRQSGLAHSVLSEEMGLKQLASNGAFLAVLDPLDGTSNAAMGFPYCALSLALEDEGGLAAALVLNYDSGDQFCAFRGHGSTRNGHRIRVSAETALAKSRIVTSRPFSSYEASLYARVMTEAKRVRIVSSPALDIAHVACGSFSAYVDYHAPKGLIHRHDVLAGKLILEEAGGLMVNEKGQPIRLPAAVAETFNVIALNSIESFDWVKSGFELVR